VPREALSPVILPPAPRMSAWQGTGQLQQFRSLPPSPDTSEAEEWLGCTVRQGGRESRSVLTDGRLLADVVAADPRGWFGDAHVAKHGTDPTFVVKLVDAGERLYLHAHPDRAFAHQHLASPYGKAEGWVIIDAKPGAVVHLGFSRDVDVAELARWVSDQDTVAMINATNSVPVSSGDAIFCPGGLPHAIGAGILFAEVQEPTDFTLLLEWDGFSIDGSTEGNLGLDLELAISCVDRRRWHAGQDTPTAAQRRESSSVVGISRLLPPEADSFFTADRIVSTDVAQLPAGFSVLVITDGHGFAHSSSFDPIRLERGQAIAVPYAAGPLQMSGSMTALRFGAGA
jgi:mannose-6-phosphate isomerase